MTASARKPRAAAPAPAPQTAGANLAPVVDELGDLEAQIAALAERAGALKAGLKDMGVGTYFGSRYYLQVSDRRTPDRIDREALYEHLDRAALIEAGIVSEGGLTLAASVKPRLDVVAEAPAKGRGRAAA